MFCSKKKSIEKRNTNQFVKLLYVTALVKWYLIVINHSYSWCQPVDYSDYSEVSDFKTDVLSLSTYPVCSNKWNFTTFMTFLIITATLPSLVLVTEHNCKQSVANK